jgi:hypothetical protein
LTGETWQSKILLRHSIIAIQKRKQVQKEERRNERQNSRGIKAGKRCKEVT